MINEIIPMGQWDFYLAANLILPIHDDLVDYQNRMQLKKMITKRDETNDVQKSSTVF
jgi:hypothetical protein